MWSSQKSPVNKINQETFSHSSIAVSDTTKSFSTFRPHLIHQHFPHYPQYHFDSITIFCCNIPSATCTIEKMSQFKCDFPQTSNQSELQKCELELRCREKESERGRERAWSGRCREKIFKLIFLNGATLLADKLQSYSKSVEAKRHRREKEGEL